MAFSLVPVSEPPGIPRSPDWRSRQRHLWQPNSLFLSTQHQFFLWNVAIPPQKYLFFGIAAPSLLQSYGIGRHRLRGPNYPTIA